MKILRYQQLFVVVMPVGREHVNVNLGFEDSIDQSMFFRNLTAPAILRLTL